MTLRAHYITGLVLCCCLSISYAESYQSIQSIKKMAESYLNQQIDPSIPGNIEIRIGYLDARLKLPQCPEKQIELFIPATFDAVSTSTVGVRCHSDRPWSIYVPVQVRVKQQVVVAAKPLARGERISESDVKFEEYNVKLLRGGYFQDTKLIIGKILKQPVYAGRPITANALVNPFVIQKGETVKIIAEVGTINVEMLGIALSSGLTGDIIKIRNLRSQRIIDAKIIGPKKVSVARLTTLN
ncbi:MAG: flagellar basal body P-ring formation chaperone FlgA [Gammaproteobacteria bacterium]